MTIRSILASALAASILFGPLTASAEAPVAAEPSAAEAELAHHNRLVSLGGVGAAFMAANIWAYFAWYRGRQISESFELRDEGWFGLNTYAGGADKLGHANAGYFMVRASAAALEAGDWEPVSATLISTSLTVAWLTLVEVKDAYHEGFGWSNNDVIVNMLGVGLGVVFHNSTWLDERFDLRLEYTPTREFIDSLLEERGVDVAEDYSGQAFMVAYHLSSIKETQRSRYLAWTRYFDVVAGYQAINYLPTPSDPTKLPRQETFWGVSLNVQQILHEWFYDDGDTEVRAGPAVAHFAAEVYGVPFTTLRLSTYERQKQTPLDLE